MADENPTGHGDAVSLTIPAADAEFLRRLFTTALEGIRDELDNHRDDLRDSTRVHREAGIYEALLAALDGKPIVPDHNTRRVLRDLMDMNDRENEHTRAVVEHEAMHDLLDRLTPCEAR